MKQLLRPLLKLAVLGGVLSSLSGCLITSPYWNQQFSSHTGQIPLQAWTTSTSAPIVFECATAFHGGLYPAFSTPTWHHVASVTPDSPGVLDPAGNRIYSAARLGTLPSQCWHQDSNNLWYSAIRATRNGSEFMTVDADGLECVGQENGDAASWFGWLGQGCHMTYSNTGNSVPYVIFRAVN